MSGDDTQLAAAATASTSAPAIATSSGVKKEETKKENHHGGSGHRNNNYDSHAIQIKSEFVLQERSPVLAADKPTPPSDGIDNNSRDDRDNNNYNNNNSSKRNKRGKRGQNKKRPRDTRISTGDKACLAVVRGESCPYGADKCKYNHDLKEMLATRQADLEGVDDYLRGECPGWKLRGYCDFGIMCRLGSCHINMSTGQNLHRTMDGTENELISPKIKDVDVDVATDVALIKEEPAKIKEEKDDDVATDVATTSDDAVTNNGATTNGATTNGATDDALIKEEPMDDEQQQQQQPTEPKVPLVKVGHQSDIKNVISRDTTIKLRKNTYPFVCKRHFEVANKNKNNNNNKQQKQGDNDNNNDNTTTNNSNNNNDTIPAVTSSSNNNNNSNNNNKPALELKERKLIDFRNKVYIAPLTTVGNLPFRRIMKQYGADITCGEMALCDQLLQGKPSEWALLKRHPSEDVFGVQIASGHADQFTRVAEILANEDGFDVDFVDMNLGCPIDLVCDKGAGACLMQRDKKLRGSLEGMMKVLPCPVTIKMRTGWDEKKPMAHSLVTNIQKWGIDGVGAIMIHGRSRLQRYSRLADWDYIAKVASIQSSDYPQIPVIGNGDIFSYTDYEEKILKHIDEGDDSNLLPTAMLGRGALIKPWLPTEIKERRHWDISASERLDMLKDFVKYGLEHYGSDQQGVNTTRRFLLEWISFLHRYVPVGMLEVLPQQMNHRPPQNMCGRSDLETLMLSKNCADWIKICEMLLGPVPDDFAFEPKHKANSY